ncbi:hypothetical protein PV04_05373 [Phialophora macrospora]|uniref:Uncharacterized protein n=1 Tax=Phialophora macrospora TaxID=1851006 RepID=A0A0D2FSL0_9EURO|nr:hypothetical protein PV04_05373 [Phialophora macrospora]
MASTFRAVHLKHAIPNLQGPFDITCAADTDIWDKPPAIHSFNAPIIYQTTTKDAFISATVTISADFKDRYDQGGLCLVVKTADRTRWVKTGIEVIGSKPTLTTVTKDEWSDASMRSLFGDPKGPATVEIRAEDDGALSVSTFDLDGENILVREVTWWGNIPGDTEVWVGPYTAKPAPNGEKDDFTAHFDGLSIKTR